MKFCFSCKTEKPLDDFHKRKNAKSGRHAYCKLCTRIKNRAWVEANKERQAAACAAWYKKNKKRAARNGSNWHYKKYYGITYDEFLELCARAKNKCEICSVDLVVGKKQANGAHLDHCHRTGQIRGVLCSLCNLAIGKFRDDPNLVRKAFQYLEERQ